MKYISISCSNIFRILLNYDYSYYLLYEYEVHRKNYVYFSIISIKLFDTQQNFDGGTGTALF